MATINERKSASGKPSRSRWQAIVRLKGQPAQTKTFMTKAEATRWARQVESEIDRGVFVSCTESQQTTVHDLLERYAREVLPIQKGGHKETSRVKSLQECLGKYSLAALTSSLIADYRDARLKIVGPQSVKHEIGLLQRALKMAVMEWGIALPGGIPTAMVKKPSLPSARTRRLVDDEEARLLDACTHARNTWLRPVVIFAIETAMRAGEMLEVWKYLDEDGGKKIKVKASDGLQWPNVDLTKRTAHLPKTKNGESRTVPLSSRAIQVLRDLPRNLDGRVFGTTYEGIHQAFVRACARASIEDFRFHDLRHEATSRFFEKGFTNPLEVAAITGHKDLKMLKRYTHFKAEDLAKKLQ
jgi:Site-specific recombinase XerD